MNDLQRVAIFGATSAIAQAVARRLVAAGSSVYCVGRDPDKLAAVVDDLKVRAAPGQVIAGEAADLVDSADYAALFEAAERALGGLDAALIAHGSLPDQVQCQGSFERTRLEIDTNAVSVIGLLTEAANRFEQKGAGVIAAIGSVAGDRGRQSNYVYGAAKGMVAIFMQGLRHRLARSGVSVVTIKPGFVDTPMTAAFDKQGPLWATPDRVARGIVRAMRRATAEAYVPGFWRLIMWVIRSIPERIFVRTRL